MASVLDLLGQAAGLLCDLEDSGGELTDELTEKMHAWLQASDDKVGACFALTRRIGVEDAELAEFEKRVKARRKSLALQKDRVNDYATALLEQREVLGEETKIKRPEFSAWLATTERVEGPEKVDDWPEDLRRTLVVVEPDKAQAKELLKKGAQIPGLSLVKTTGIRWRVA